MTLKVPRLGIVDFLGLLFAGVFFYSLGSLTGDPGVGWHLKTGEWIFQNGAVPNRDPFLFPSKAWVANQWLADLIIWLVYQLGDWELVHAFFGVVILSAFHLVVAPVALRRSSSQLIAFAVVMLVSIVGSIQWIIRPVVFSFLMYALTFRLCSYWSGNQEARKKCLLAFAGLFALWPNLHPAFPVGLMLVGSLALQNVVENGWQREALKESLLLVLVCVLATSMNPYGLGLYLYIFGLIGDSYFMGLNMEWRSPDFHARGFPAIAVFYASLLLAAPFALKSGAKLFEFIMVAALAYLSLSSRRYSGFLALSSVGILAVGWTEIVAEINSWAKKGSFLYRLGRVASDLTRKGTAVFYTTVALSFLFLITLFTGNVGGVSRGNFGPERWMPDESLAALTEALNAGEQATVFHTPDFGGYLTYRYWPKLIPFIDDRNQLNEQDRYERYFRVVRLNEGWKEELSSFDWVVLKPNEPVLLHLKSFEGWEEVGRDDNAVLLKRAD